MRENKISKERFIVEVEKSKDLMFRLSRNILENPTDAEDAVAEAMMRAWEKRNQIKDVEKFGKWMVSIVVNVSKDMRIAREKEKLIGNKELAACIDKEQEESMDLWSLVPEISEVYRIAFLLYYYAGYSVKEISDVLHVAEGTIKSRLSRAREEFKRMLE